MPSTLHTTHTHKAVEPLQLLTKVNIEYQDTTVQKLIASFIIFLVDRVQEAEREVSKMLLKSIEHHIQDAGKALLKTDEGNTI